MLLKNQIEISSISDLDCIIDDISIKLNYIEMKSIFLSVFLENFITSLLDNINHRYLKHTVI